MSYEDDLVDAKNIIGNAIKAIKENPKQPAIADLLDALEVIDEHYRDFCVGCDADFDEKPGYTYKHGISLEYYIESSWWHDVSKALRVIRPLENNDDNQ